MKREAEIYTLLHDTAGFPKLFYVGPEGEYNVLVIELLGHTIEELCQLCHGQLSIPTVYVLGEQMVPANKFDT